jgi:hypothetical protein
VTGQGEGEVLIEIAIHVRQADLGLEDGCLERHRSREYLIKEKGADMPGVSVIKMAAGFDRLALPLPHQGRASASEDTKNKCQS